MHRSLLRLAATAILTACASHSHLPPDLADRLATTPEEQSARLRIDAAGIAVLALPIRAVELPPAARTGVEAVAPQGTVTFIGREWHAHGTGFRVDKRYEVEGTEHTRSVLVDAAGQVLERIHSVPIAEVPEAVLATAARFGPAVERIEIVAGARHEDHWRCLVADRSGRHFVVRTDLQGNLLDCRRRLPAQLDG